MKTLKKFAYYEYEKGNDLVVTDAVGKFSVGERIKFFPDPDLDVWYNCEVVSIHDNRMLIYIY